MEPIILLLALIFGVWLYIFVPAKMAERRGRSAFGWVLISLIFSPLIAIIALWVLGHPYRPDRHN
jgi:hypothetical protein